MKYVHVGVVVETRLVRVDVRVGEAGAFVGCLASDARFLERVCGEFNMCVLGRKTGFPACGQQSVMLTYVRDGEWKGYFPRITDMKTILCAVRECVDFCGVPMADQIRLDSWT